MGWPDENNDNIYDSNINISSGKVTHTNTLKNMIMLPFRLIWNIIVTGLIVGGFVLWFGFIFGSVIAVILILIFAPHLFLLPLVFEPMYTEIWPED